MVLPPVYKNKCKQNVNKLYEMHSMKLTIFNRTMLRNNGFLWASVLVVAKIARCVCALIIRSIICHAADGN